MTAPLFRFSLVLFILLSPGYPDSVHGEDPDLPSLMVYEKYFEDEVYFSEINNLVATPDDHKILDQAVIEVTALANRVAELRPGEIDREIERIRQETLLALRLQKQRPSEEYKLKTRVFSIVDFLGYLGSQMPGFYLLLGMFLVLTGFSLALRSRKRRFGMLIICLLLLVVIYALYWQPLLSELDRYVRIRTYPALNLPRPFGYYAKPLVNIDYVFELIREIQNAKRSIDIAMFLMQRGTTADNPVNLIARELVEAKKRGVAVRVVLDNPGTSDPHLYESNNAAKKYLNQHGIATAWDLPETELHEKLVIIDGTAVFVGNHNWSWSSLRDNNEFSVLIKSNGWQDDLYGHILPYFPKTAADPVDKSPYSRTGLLPVENFMLLQGNAYYWQLKICLQQAQQAIDIIMFYIATSSAKDHPVRQLLQELVSAHQRGVKVRVIMDEAMLEKNITAYRFLKQAGIDVRFDESRVMTHTKLVVVDGRRILTGSHNWTTSAFQVNLETSVYFESAEIAAAVAKLWSDIYYPVALPVLRMDLNAVDEKTLCKLPGIGPAHAEQIVVFRSELGVFTDKYQLLEIPDFGVKRFEKIMWQIYTAEKYSSFNPDGKSPRP